jgi:dipeptidyl aminopeptidase/acylaminoacyl peptidase
MVRVPAPGEAASGAGVLLLPGEGLDAGDLLVPAHRLAQRGVTCVIVAAPGRGRSSGPDDFAGRASLAAALAGLDTLARQPGVDPGRLAAWGISRGGTVALLLALERPAALRAVIAQSASYDLWASHRAAVPADRPAIEAAAGRDSAGWRERSPLLRAASIKPAVLVLHGELDDVFPAGPAHAFAEAATAAGANVTGRFPPQGRHALTPVEASRFLQAQLITRR